jgi:hypothetical protein
MNLKWKLGALFLLSALVMLWPASAKRNSAAQEAKPDYKNNNCVSCHSGLLDPLRLGNRYLEWQFSLLTTVNAFAESAQRPAYDGV